MNEQEKIKINDQKKKDIDIFAQYLVDIVKELGMPSYKLQIYNNLKITPVELVRMIIAEKNDKIEELSAYVNSVIEIFKALNPTDEEIEKNSDSEEPTHNLIIRKIKEKNDKIKLLEERLSGIRAITNFKF